MRRNLLRPLAALLALASLPAWAGSLVQPDGALIADQYIVVLDRDAAARSGPLRTVAQRLVGSVGGGEVLHVYDSGLQGFAVRLPAVAAEALARSPLVRLVEQDQVMHIVGSQTSAPYNLDRIDQRNLPLSTTYDYPGTVPGSGVHVYVIDTGLRSTHVDFDQIGNGQNFASGSGGLLCQLLGINCPAPVPTDTSDCNGHGTHVSGTSTGNTWGAAKSATLHPVRVFGCGNSTATSTIIAGVEWVTANRQLPAVANMSLGGGASTALDDAVRALIASSVTVVVAAGNESADACGSSPARVPEAITVGATTSTDARASYSNYGSCVDLFAPGSNVVSASYQSDTGTATLSGTSMASPLVAGVAARYLSGNTGAAPAAVQSALIAASTTGVVGNPGTGSPNRLVYAAPN